MHVFLNCTFATKCNIQAHLFPLATFRIEDKCHISFYSYYVSPVFVYPSHFFSEF